MAENLSKAANTPFLMEKAKSMPFLRGNLIDREDFVEAFDEYGDEFTASMGAEAVQMLLQELDLEEEYCLYFNGYQYNPNRKLYKLFYEVR